MRKKVLAIALAIGVAFSLAACDEDGASGFALGHFDGSDTTNGYDTDLLYKNTSEFLGGDSGVLWVSEEEDPEYGGWFYQYMSECGSVYNYGTPSDENGNVASGTSDAAYTGHVTVTRSRDLYDWEMCGVVDNGLGVKLGLDAFMSGKIWAPETIRDPKTGKYYMYFGGQASSTYVEKYKSLYGGTLSGNSTFGTIWAAGCAVSDTPVGPFELVTSENSYDGGANPNGEILTEETPTFDYAKWFGPDCRFPYYCTDFSPFFDENGDLYLYWNTTAFGGISCWGMKMLDMATPDYSTITLLMTTGNTSAPYSGDDGPADPSKPWRDGKIANPVRLEYKGNAENNAAIKPAVGEDTAHYEVNETFVNDPEFPRFDPNSYIQWEEWRDGTPNTKTITVDGKEVDNPAYNPGNGTVREGVQCISYKDKAGKTKYYLTFTYVGVGSADYNVYFATSTSPIGVKGEEFELPKNKEFGMSIGVDENNDYMSNLGHIDYVEVDGEWWIVHWEWTHPFGASQYDIGRIYALSPMTWLDDPSVDYYVPLANGPTQYLQAKPSVATGYKNIAKDAKITATNVQGDTLKYLTDGYTVTKNMYRDWALRVKKETVITVKFDEPRTVRGLLIYNAYDYENAFSKIANIQFTLAEKPACYTGTGDGLSCHIDDLGFPESYKASERIMYSGVASVATFDELKVSEIKITIKDHLGNSDILNISELMILGK